MIYYVTKINMVTHDETVMTSHDNLEQAVNAHSGFTAGNTDENVTFRIDTVLNTSEEIAEANKRIPPSPFFEIPLHWDKYRAIERKKAQRARDELQARLNAEYSKSKMDHEEGYPDSDSMRTKDFTVDELFPEASAGDYIASPCKECGALVIDTGFHDYTAKHVAWHNKLLP